MLGQRLRNLRHDRGMSLKQLSEAAGVSIALLSQVERDQLDPSLDTLRKLAKAFNIPLFSLFQETPETSVAVVPHNRRPSLTASPGAVAYSRVSPGFGRLEVLEGTLEPGAASSPELWEHNSEECAVVLEGTLVVEFATDSYTLLKGDSIYFDSRRAHRYVNTSTKPCIYLVTVTPPSF
ncbi:MAG: XRE family transcriptional regulator [Sulfobacillus benefaciens]|uniref:XRE family transcriptional regulator n=1 Tax=Sulfobacillus benefaciens TaxID=453960 RepID=A0A2T2XJ70_9FIRM|nr:MAG: XRE family transcriptional regulator [Sulfobacillus benefaciens]